MNRGATLAACLALVCWAALASCEAPAPPSPPRASFTAAPHDSAAVARVGDVSIPGGEVARIAAAQRVSPAEARDLAVRDALFALEARARGIDAERDVELRVDAILARALIEDLNAAAEAQGPVTDAELDEVTARHWTELDRPEAARVVHAVVMVDKGTPPAARAKAPAIAEAIRRALGPAADEARATTPPADPRAADPAVALFRSAAAGVETEGLEVRVEPLSPVVADGRMLAGGTLDPAFSGAAVALERRGDVSPVVQTPFGFHVLLLLERIPAQIVPREERRQAVREEVVTGRAHAAKEKLLTGLRADVRIDRSLDALLALVPAER